MFLPDFPSYLDGGRLTKKISFLKKITKIGIPSYLDGGRLTKKINFF